MRHALQLLALLFVAAGSGHAYIDAMNATLEQFSGGFATIQEGVIEKVDLERKAALLKLGRALKGKPELTHARLAIGADGRGYPDAVLKHLVPGAPVVVWYYWGSGPKTAVYLNRFFLEFYRGEGGDPARPWWHLNAVATLYNRTYNGPVEELVPLLDSLLAGKVKGPPLDLKLPSITQDTLMALPPWGQAGPGKKLPPPFRRRLTADKDRPRDADKTATLAPGLRLESFEGNWETLPDFGSLKPTKTATAESVGVAGRPRDEGYALRFSGFLDVPKDGVYGFSLVSNDGARLSIGGTEVVDNDHLKTVVEGQGEIALKAGKHAFRVDYFQHSGFQVLEVYWQGPGLGRAPIPTSALWRTP